MSIFQAVIKGELGCTGQSDIAFYGRVKVTITPHAPTEEMASLAQK